MKKLNTLLALITLFATGSSAHAFGVIGGLNFHNIQGGTTDSAFIGGLSFEGSALPGLHTELDLMYGEEKFNNGSFNAIQAPLLLRFTLLPIIDLGAGPYVTYITTELASGSNHFDIGAVGSLRAVLPLAAIKLTLEGRYLFGFTNLTSSGTATRAVQALAGLQFGF